MYGLEFISGRGKASIGRINFLLKSQITMPLHAKCFTDKHDTPPLLPALENSSNIFRGPSVRIATSQNWPSTPPLDTCSTTPPGAPR